MSTQKKKSDGGEIPVSGTVSNRKRRDYDGADRLSSMSYLRTTYLLTRQSERRPIWEGVVNVWFGDHTGMRDLIFILFGFGLECGLVKMTE